MCDIYMDNCEICDIPIAMHIGDFCTDRENVHPYCHVCSPKAAKSDERLYFLLDEVNTTDVRDATAIINGKRWFAASMGIEEDDEDFPIQGAKFGDKTLTMCDDRKAWDVYPNG